MALEFRKRRFHKPSKKMQYALAVIALLLVLCLVFSWMMIRHKLDQMHTASSSPDDSSAVSKIEYSQEEKSNALLIYHTDETVRFMLVQADPAAKGIHLASISEEITLGDSTLSEIYKKEGAVQVTNALADALDLPLRHYISMSDSKAVSWFSRLENGVEITLPEKIEYTENVVSHTLPKGKQVLDASQIKAVLGYTDWNDRARFDRVGVEIIAAMLNQYMDSDRNLTADFSQLANLVQTSLRIGDFNDSKAMLTYLAEQNDGNFCQIYNLPIKEKNGEFSLNVTAFKKSVFYDNRK